MDRARRRAAAAVRRLLRHLRARQRGRPRPGATPGRVGGTRRPPLRPGAQRAGHGAHRSGLRADEGPAPDVRRLDERRAGRHQPGHRSRPRDHQPDPRAAAARRHVRGPQRLALAAGARAPVRGRRDRQRHPPSGLEVLRPRVAARAASGRTAVGHARTHRPRRDRRGHGLLPAGRAGRGARLARRAVRQAGLARVPAAAGDPCPPGGRGRDPLGEATAGRGRRRRRLRPGRRGARYVLRGDGDPRRPEPGRQGRTRVRPPAVPGRDRLDRQHRRQRDRARGRRRDRDRHPLLRLHDREPHRLPTPRRPLYQHQRRAHRRGEARRRGRPRRRAGDARGAHQGAGRPPRRPGVRRRVHRASTPSGPPPSTRRTTRSRRTPAPAGCSPRARCSAS